LFKSYEAGDTHGDITIPQGHENTTYEGRTLLLCPCWTRVGHRHL